MSASALPERPSLEYLKKLAKDRLRALRRRKPKAKLADAQRAVALAHGFSTWRAMKAEVERRQSQQAGAWTPLHEAAKRGDLDAVRQLLAQGADPNAREKGDNTYPLHWAAARGDFKVMTALLDAGGDVHGFGADHAGDVIGWGTFFPEPGKDVRAVADFLVARGARHSIFSAMSVGDLDLIRAVIKDDPRALNAHLSKWEHGVTPLQVAIVKQRDDIVDLLIALGADLEAEDMHGQTALAGALALGNERAAKRLRAAGAKPPKTIVASEFRERVAKLAESVPKLIPMINVPDVAAALEWYVSIGFTEVGRFADEGTANWGLVRFGSAEVMLSMHDTNGRQPVSLWFYTKHVDELYALFKARQMADRNAVDVFQDIYDPFYGGREFGIRDPHGYELYFRRG